MEHILVTLHLYRQLPMPLPMVSPYTRDHDLTLFEAREKRQLHTCRVAEDAKNRFETGRSDSDGLGHDSSNSIIWFYEQFRGFRSGHEQR